VIPWIVALLALPVLVYAFRGTWIAVGVRHLAGKVGATVEIGAVEGGLFGDLVLAGVEWRAPGHPVRALADGRLEAQYSLWGLLRGRDDWLRSVVVTAERLELALDGEAEADAEAEAGDSAPPRLPRGWELRLDVGSCLLRGAPRGDLEGPLRVRAREADGRVVLEELRLGALAIRAGTLEPREGGDVAWSLPFELGATAGSVEGALEDGSVDGRLRATAVDLEELATLLKVDAGSRPHGTAELELRARFTTAAPADGSFELTTSVVGAGWRGRPLESLRATASLQGGALTVAELRAESGANTLTLRELSVPLPLEDTRSFLASARGRARLTVEDLPALLEGVGPPERVPAHRIVLDARLAEGRLAEMSGRLDASGGSAVLRSGVVEGLAGEDLLDARLDLDLDVRFDDLAGLGAVLARPGPWAGALTGDLEVQGSLRRPVGHLVARATSLALEGLVLERAELDVRADAAEVRLTRLDARAGTWSASAAAVWTHGRGATPSFLELDELRWRGASGELELVRSARFEPTGDGWRADPVVIRGGEGTASAAVELAPGTVRAELRLDRFDSGPVLGSWIPSEWDLGPLGGELALVRSPSGLELRGELELPAIAPGPERPRWSAAVAAELAGGRLRLHRLEGSSRVGRLRVAADVPFDPSAPQWLAEGDLSLDLDAEGLDLAAWSEWGSGPGVTGTLALGAALTGTWSRLEGPLTVEGSAISPAVSPDAGDDLPRFDLLAEAELGEELRIRTASLRWSETVRAELGGSVGTEVSVRRALEDPRSYLRAPLRLQADLTLSDLAWIAPRVDALRRVQGRVRAHGELTGTYEDPVLTGDLSIEEGELRLASELPAIRGLSARIALTEELWTLESAGGLGGAPVRLAGTIDLSGEAPVLDLDLEGENLLLYRSPTVKVRAQTALNLGGPAGALRATGSIVLTEGRSVRQLVLLDGLRGGGGPAPERRGFFPSLWREPPLSSLELDLVIQSSAPFRVDNNVTRLRLRPELRLTGTGEAPVFEGVVYVDPSTVSLPSGRLRLDSGLFQFPPESPYLPELSLFAEARIKGYDVDVRITGPYDRPEVLLTSNPPLPDDELLLLFLTGQLPTGTASERGLGAAETVAVYLAEDALTRWLAGPDLEDEEGLLDRLDVDVGAQVSDTGAPTAEVRFYVTSQADRPGRAVYLAAERDVHDFVNYGFGVVFRFR
jgi:hypothetical protein